MVFQAACDDMMPLIEPVKTAAGETVNEVQIGAGTLVVVPIRAINRSEKVWGADAKVFKPERWLDQESGLTSKSKEYTGYHHLLSFTGGPRICLGRLFAVTEFKVTMIQHSRRLYNSCCSRTIGCTWCPHPQLYLRLARRSRDEGRNSDDSSPSS